MARTLIFYPGGKGRAVEQISAHLPRGLTDICSPFLGGASLELAWAREGIRVFGADIFAPLINFWICALNWPGELADRVQTYFPLTRERFYALQKGYSGLGLSMSMISTIPNMEQAAVFFALNRASFSGLTFSGGMRKNEKHTRFTQSAIDRLRYFRARMACFSSCADWRSTLNNYPGMFLYLDPPYFGDYKLYGHRGDLSTAFDHDALACALRKRDGWMLSYNDCEEVRELYRGYRFASIDVLYTMRRKWVTNREVLILAC